MLNPQLPADVVSWFEVRGISAHVLAQAGVCTTMAVPPAWLANTPPAALAAQPVACVAFPYWREGTLVNVTLWEQPDLDHGAHCACMHACVHAA